MKRRHRVQYCWDLAALQNVWAAITRNPRISIREIAAQSGLKMNKTQRCINTLIAFEYIGHERYKNRAWDVRFPLYEARIERGQVA